MSKMVKLFKEHCVLLLSIGLMVSGFIYLFYQMITVVIENVNQTTCFLLFKKITYGLIKYSNITEYKYIDVIICYFEIFLIYVVMRELVAIVFGIIVAIIEQVLKLLQRVLFGEKHEKSLQYSTFQVWFLKVEADVNEVIFWIKYKVCGITYSEDTELSMLKKAKLFTLETMVNFLKKIFKKIYGGLGMHILFAVYAICIYYLNWIQDIFKRFSGFLTTYTFSASNAIDLFELISIILIIGYIILDVRHKANGYLEIRMERFKELFQLEERLLYVLKKINNALEKNLNLIVAKKQYILQDGAENLTGEICRINGANILYENKESLHNFFYRDRYSQLQDFEEMNEEFNELKEINEEFIKSSLSRSNIFWIDHNAMLTKFHDLYLPGQQNFEYKKIKLFCKSSMKIWFKNHFIEPTKCDNEGIYYSEEKAKQVVLSASEMLDYELMNAFELEVHLKRYVKKMEKRFRKINTFSKFNLR